MALDASVIISDNSKTKYLCNLLCGEVLSYLDTLCAQVESKIMAHLNRVILGLGMFFIVDALSKKNHTIRRRMRNP